MVGGLTGLIQETNLLQHARYGIGVITARHIPALERLHRHLGGFGRLGISVSSRFKACGSVV
jgi:hypothetical protein